MARSYLYQLLYRSPIEILFRPAKPKALFSDLQLSVLLLVVDMSGRIFFFYFQGNFVSMFLYCTTHTVLIKPTLLLVEGVGSPEVGVVLEQW